MIHACLIFLLPFSASGNVEPAKFRDTPLKASMGVYYEYQGSMIRVTGTWRVTVFLDLHKIQNPWIYTNNYSKSCQACACQDGNENSMSPTFTHIVRAQLIELHELSKSNNERLIRHEDKMFQNNLRLENLTWAVAELKQVEALTHVFKAVESSLDDYIRTDNRILEVIHTSRQGRMHLSLLTS